MLGVQRMQTRPALIYRTYPEAGGGTQSRRVYKTRAGGVFGFFGFSFKDDFRKCSKV